LKKWSEKNGKSGGNSQVGKYIGIYAVFGISLAGLVLMQNMVMFLSCAFVVSISSTLSTE
jgi:ATP-binding cassette subfamily C (CFTR/MRP) protein 1